jgi:hypothetical protein
MDPTGSRIGREWWGPAPYINIFSFLPFWDIIYETEALFCVCFFLFFFSWLCYRVRSCVRPSW